MQLAFRQTARSLQVSKLNRCSYFLRKHLGCAKLRHQLPGSSCGMRSPRYASTCQAANAGETGENQSGNESPDEMLRTIAVNGEVVVTVVNAHNLINNAVSRHFTAPTASAALGRCLTGTLLMASFRGEGETVQVQFKGDGPLQSITCIGDHEGNVRGFVGNPQANPPVRTDGKLNVGGAIGRGILTVVRSLPMLDPYSGMVPITSGEVAEDLAVYLRDSEQSNSALGLGVSIYKDGTVQSAGGFYVQVLPLVSDSTLDHLERNLTGLPPVTELFNSGKSPQEITDMILEGIGSSPGAQSVEPQYGPCECNNIRTRMLRAVAAIPPNEIEELLQEQGKVQVRCEFCCLTVDFDRSDLTQLLA